MKVTCSNCKHQFDIPLPGQLVACPMCGMPTMVPI